MVRRDAKKKENDLDKIQELFPNDHLRLYDRDPLSPRKGLIRSKSATLKLQRAISGKSKAETNQQPARRQFSSNYSSNTEDERHREFVMDGPVQFTIGVQSQERHLFLFQDFLLIAKPRPSGTYKLKEKVLVCELWISECIEEVSEIDKAPETSFVLGWPTTNVVATFSSNQTRNLWKSKLEQLLLEAKEREGLSLNSIHVTYLDADNKQEYPKVLRITNSHTAADCVRLLLRQLCLQEEDGKDFQLWVRSHKDESPYPLIGHEFPFSIKMNLIRELLQRSELDLLNLGHISTDSKCSFVLRRHSHRTSESVSTSPYFGKKIRKIRRQTLINWPFKKQVSKSDSTEEPSPLSSGSLLGWSLSSSWSSQELPLPIKVILVQLYLKGPSTIGIFRKSANARILRELKEKIVSLGSGAHQSMEDMSCLKSASSVVLASLLKEFLRGLPDCLLQSHTCHDWLDAVNLDYDWQTREKFICLLGKLPPMNLQLLKHLICVLYRIAQNSCENKMSSGNLAVCIGPSLLSPPNMSSSPCLQNEDVSKKVPKVVAYLIDNCQSLFGKDCLLLFREYSSHKESSRQDSGAEEEIDSFNDSCVRGGRDGIDVRNSFHRDDSSIDSLEHDLLEECEPSPKPTCRTKVSLTNLSRDSGLTLSDTQLYTPEEEMEESETSSGSDSRKHLGSMYTKSVPDLFPSESENAVRTATAIGVSIDGSCHDVVRKRRQFADNSRSQTLSSIPYSGKCNYDGLFVTPKTSRDSLGGPVKLRERKINSMHRRQIQSSLEPLQRSYSGQPMLQRSASEESLLQLYMDGPSNFQRRPALHRKGRAPSPPEEKPNGQWSRNHYRQPDPQAVWFANHSGTMDWKRSQSTSKIDQIDGVPNNLSPKCPSKTIPIAPIETSSQSCGDLHIYENTRNLRYVEASNVPQTGEYATYSLSSMKQEPPSYQEAMNRRNILKRLQPPAVATSVTDQMRQEQTSLSARAKQLYEESLKLYNQKEITVGKDTHHAVPAQINSLQENQCRSSPPSNHSVITKSLSEGSPRIGSDNSTAASLNPRLRHLPPVHVTDAQIHINRVPKKKVIACQRTWRECPDIPDDLKGGINWSVAQLRLLFNSSQTNNCKNNGIINNNNKTNTQKWKTPPPYRLPPTPSSKILYIDRMRCSSLDSNGAEESFV